MVKNTEKVREFCQSGKVGIMVYSHWASSLTLGKNTLISITMFSPSVSVGIKTSVKSQMGSGPIEKRQRWYSVWTQPYLLFFTHLRLDDETNQTGSFWSSCCKYLLNPRVVHGNISCEVWQNSYSSTFSWVLVGHKIGNCPAIHS